MGLRLAFTRSLYRFGTRVQPNDDRNEPGGVLYASFKYGAAQRTKAGRVFTDMNEERLREVIGPGEAAEIVSLWKTVDARPVRSAEVWLNVLIRRPDIE